VIVEKNCIDDKIGLRKEFMTPLRIQKIQEKVAPVLKKYGIIRAGLFGSFARGEMKKNSDIDFYVIYPKRTSLFDMSGLANDLEEKVGRKVDLANGKALRKEFKPYILKDLTIIYEKTK
jgi:hypothetical protein